MSVEFRKSGVIKSSGADINENLLAVQLHDSKWALWGYDIGTREKVVIGGKTWAHVISGAEETRYGGFTCSPVNNQITIDSSKRYTWNCVAMAGNAANAEIILWNHWRSTEGGANIAQHSQRIKLTSDPLYISWTLPQYTNATYTVNLINLMIGSYKADNEIYFTDLKFEEGVISTPWIPHIDDDMYTGREHGFIEPSTFLNTRIYQEHIEANEFVEY